MTVQRESDRRWVRRRRQHLRATRAGPVWRLELERSLRTPVATPLTLPPVSGTTRGRAGMSDTAEQPRQTANTLQFADTNRRPLPTETNRTLTRPWSRHVTAHYKIHTCTALAKSSAVCSRQDRPCGLPSSSTPRALAMIVLVCDTMSQTIAEVYWHAMHSAALSRDICSRRAMFVVPKSDAQGAEGNSVCSAASTSVATKERGDECL